MKWHIYIYNWYGQKYDRKREKVRVCTAYSPEERDECIALFSQRHGEQAWAKEVKTK